MSTYIIVNQLPHTFSSHIVPHAVLHGYPPVEISSYQTNGYLKDLKIRSGDTITVVELSEPHASLDQADSQGESPSELHNDDVIFISEERPTVKQHIDGQLARKYVCTQCSLKMTFIVVFLAE